MIIYLYVKQHTVTGLKYFGKTQKVDPFSYYGSGLYWMSHLKKHGKFIRTLEIFGFDNQELCSEFALKFSEDNDIVNSKEWANLQPENGRDGVPAGRPRSQKTKDKISKANKGKRRSQEIRDKISIVLTGRRFSNDLNKKPVTLEGRTFSSHAEAAEFYNVTPETIARWRKRGKIGDPNWCIRKKPIIIDGKEYDSIAEASRCTGILENTIRYRIKTGKIIVLDLV